MVISSIISEYNPFHNGHKYQIEQTKKKGATHIISIMSGNFTQRGTPSILSKHIKTEIALKNGCDLIIELPTVYSIAGAEKFAYGATFLTNSLGCVDLLSFGCENNNISLLKKAAEIANNEKTITLTKEYLKNGISFAKARYYSIKDIYGEDLAHLFSKSNNILAIEYIKSLKALQSNINPLPILRHGVNHNSTFSVNNFASSTFLRNMILNNNYDIENFVPNSCFTLLYNNVKHGFAPANLLNCERAILFQLRRMEASDFFNIQDVSEGLENKIYKAVKESTTLDEIYLKIKTKRYTQLRIQRILISAFLGINKDILKYSPPYIKVLGFNKKGEEILHTISQTATLPIVTNLSDIKKIKSDKVAMTFWETECRAYDLYNLMLPSVQKCGYEMTSKVIKV